MREDSDPPSQSSKLSTGRSEDFDEEHSTASRTPLLYADAMNNAPETGPRLGSDVAADGSETSGGLLASRLKDNMKNGIDGNVIACSFQQTSCRNVASQTEEDVAERKDDLDACGEDLIQFNDTTAGCNPQRENPINQGISDEPEKQNSSTSTSSTQRLVTSDVSTSMSDLTQFSHDSTQTEDISTTTFDLIAVRERSAPTQQRLVFHDACTSTSDLSQLSPSVESNVFDNSRHPTGLTDLIPQDLFPDSLISRNPSGLAAECLTPLLHSDCDTVNSTGKRMRKVVSKDLSQDSHYSDDENTTDRSGSVTSDTISLSIGDEEPVSSFNGEGQHHNTERKTILSSDPTLVRQESGTESNLLDPALSIPEGGTDLTAGRVVDRQGSGAERNLPEFVDLAVSRQSSSGCAIGPAVNRQESTDIVIGREDGTASVQSVVLNIGRVENLFIEVLPVCEEISLPGDGEEGRAHPVCLRVDWDENRQRAIDAERRAGEERVRRAKNEKREVKKRCQRKMKSLAEGYIREWRDDVLERELDRARERQQYFDRVREMEIEADSEIDRLQERIREEQRQTEEIVADILKQLEHEREQPSTAFILKAQQIEENRPTPCVAETMSSGLESVVQRLYRDFHVRLLAGDKGLLFLMEALTAQWATVQENQEGIRRLLEELLPEATRGEVRWTEVRECGSVRAGDIHVGQAVPEKILRSGGVPSDRNQGASSWNQMTASLRRVFGPVKPETAEVLRVDGPGVGALAVTESGRIVVLDWRNKMVKVANFNPLLHAANGTGLWTGVQLRNKLFSMTLVSGEVVAVTASMQKFLFFVDVSGDVFDVRQVDTQRLYYGICSVPSDGTLIVGTKQDGDGLASLYQINQGAEVLKIIVDSTMQLELCTPFHLCFNNSTIVVSNTEGHSVLLFDFPTGCFKEKLSGKKNMKGPRQVAMDKNGNLFIACVDKPSQCVTLVSPDRRWRRLLEGRNAEEGDPPRVDPIGVALTDYGLVVSWHEWDSYSVVCVYSWM